MYVYVLLLCCAVLSFRRFTKHVYHRNCVFRYLLGLLFSIISRRSAHLRRINYDGKMFAAFLYSPANVWVQQFYFYPFQPALPPSPRPPYSSPSRELIVNVKKLVFQIMSQRNASISENSEFRKIVLQSCFVIICFSHNYLH